MSEVRNEKEKEKNPNQANEHDLLDLVLDARGARGAGLLGRLFLRDGLVLLLEVLQQARQLQAGERKGHDSDRDCGNAKERRSGFDRHRRRCCYRRLPSRSRGQGNSPRRSKCEKNAVLLCGRADRN